MVALKGAILDVCNLLTAPRTVQHAPSSDHGAVVWKSSVYHLTQSQYADTGPTIEMVGLICNFYPIVAARNIVLADPSLRYSSMLLGR